MRLRQLDFLRGIAILLVLVRHDYISIYLKKIGWIGVDLFFVLSGFLVSGILFKSIIYNQRLNVVNFLVRRGFKIYPIYYLCLPFYFFLNRNNLLKTLPELFFVQNYYFGWGYLLPASWSLAVEEHFYIFICVLLLVLFKFFPKIFLTDNKFFKVQKFVFILLALMLFILVLRIIRVCYYRDVLFDIDNELVLFKTFTMSHLRLDSLFIGVVVSYLYYFDFDSFKFKFLKNTKILLFLSILGLSWTPFLEVLDSSFGLTFGLSFVSLSFGIIISFFLLYENVNNVLNKIFSKIIVDKISKIGFSSYSIYIIHTFINHVGPHVLSYLGFKNFYITDFVFNFILSVFLGYLVTIYVEKFFLKLRDLYFPAI